MALYLDRTYERRHIAGPRAFANGFDPGSVVAPYCFEFRPNISWLACGFIDDGAGLARGSYRSQLIIPGRTGSRSRRHTVRDPFFPLRVQPALHCVQYFAAKPSGDFQMM